MSGAGVARRAESTIGRRGRPRRAELPTRPRRGHCQR